MTINNENIENLPVELLEMILEKTDTSSLYNLKKTSKLFNQVTNDYLDRTKVIEEKTDIFKLELSFELNSLTDIELNKIINSNIKIYDYIDVVKIDIVNISTHDKLIVYNMIHYNINDIKESFNSFLKNNDIYKLLMNIKNKYFELLINITSEQDLEIYKMIKKKERFTFSPIGDEKEYKFIYNKLNQNIHTSNKKSKSDLIWVNMQNIVRSRSTQRKKNSINIKLDLTYS
tara:strand:- start:3798 stop:4490 length:693 start_codon:yes stop_codon:yes gene_type:complete